MRAKIKGFHSPEIENFQNFNPIENDNFCFLLQIMIGPDDDNGEESFDIEVCTPRWLLLNYAKDEIIFGKHFLIVFEYDFDRIFKKIKTFVESCDGNNWCEIAEKINTIAHWEYENYKDS